jgi:hypothetical protein
MFNNNNIKVLLILIGCMIASLTSARKTSIPPTGLNRTNRLMNHSISRRSSK